MRSAVIVTGATGFLGSHLVLQWLKDFPDHAVVCLARRNRDASARERVLQALRNAERDTGAPGPLSRYTERLIVIEDNLLSRDPGSEPSALADLDGLELEAFWHSAASVKFVETDTHEVWNTNVRGLQNALALADRLRVPIFNQISTAYSCGTMSGRILETTERSPAAFNNIYEESKHHGEQLVRGFCEAHRMHTVPCRAMPA